MNEVKQPKKTLAYFYCVAAILLMLFNLFVLPKLSEEQVKTVDYGTFMSMTEDGNIGLVDISSNRIIFTNKDETEFYRTGLMDDPNLTERLYKAGAEFSTEIIEQQSPLLSMLLSWVIPVVLFIVVGQYLSRQMMNKAGGGPGSLMFNMGKSNAKIYVKSSEGIKFTDVAGVDEAEESLSEIVEYLHDPEKYKDIGASMPKGILLVGPPGTGKTLLAKAVAGEANVPFFSISGSEFVEMFVGMGASKVRDLFRQAKEKAPCIVFIDEIDAIGKKRGGQYGGNDEREQTLNQLLTEMDGFESNNGVIILAATNQPESLDPALTRPGRFDRRVPVELPDLKGREEILEVHGKKFKLDDTVDFEKIARMASGASGAELANILLERNTKGTLNSFLGTLKKTELVVIDEIGFVPLHKDAAELLFQVISDCYERKSLIITSNLEFSQWNTVFGDNRLTAALVDRLIHHSHIIIFSGESYRLTQSMNRRRTNKGV